MKIDSYYNSNVCLIIFHSTVFNSWYLLRMQNGSIKFQDHKGKYYVWFTLTYWKCTLQPYVNTNRTEMPQSFCLKMLNHFLIFLGMRHNKMSLFVCARTSITPLHACIARMYVYIILLNRIFWPFTGKNKQ